jgi:hypothetical protein
MLFGAAIGGRRDGEEPYETEKDAEIDLETP